jgi:hypothetical protein
MTFSALFSIYDESQLIDEKCPFFWGEELPQYVQRLQLRSLAQHNPKSIAKSLPRLIDHDETAHFFLAPSECSAETPQERERGQGSSIQHFPDVFIRTHYPRREGLRGQVSTAHTIRQLFGEETKSVHC